MGLLIGITGRAGAGKDTFADHLCLNYGFEAMAFADPLKGAASIMFDVPVHYFYDRDLKEEIIPEWGMSPRHMAQRLGTEAVRNTFGPDFWIKRWLQGYRAMPISLDVVVTDVRFNNEAQAIRDLGGVIVQIKRPGESELDTSAMAHASETGIGYFSSHDKIIVNDGTIADLHAKVSVLFGEGA